MITFWLLMFCFFVIRQTHSSTRTDTRCHYTKLFRPLHRQSVRRRGRPRAVDAAQDAFRERQARQAAREPQGIARALCRRAGIQGTRSEEHTSELQSLMRISYAVCCLKTKIQDEPLT